MDKLLECAIAYQKLLDITYKIILGRKGKQTKLQIFFEPIGFHHLIGLHKLIDLRIARASRKKEQCFLPFSNLESLLDQNQIVFRYNTKSNHFSLIEADYLLSTPYAKNDIYLFLTKHMDTGQYFCRSFFPKAQIDYTKGQALYTMLYKEKIYLSTGISQIQYDRLISKEPKKVEN